MKRSKHSLSHYKLVTCDMGKLYPVGLFEVLPGDSVQQATSALIRVSPMVAPVMHPVTVRIHHWFVPNRLVWEGWEDFITGGPDGIGGASGEYPTIAAPFAAKTLADFFGIPPTATVPVSALPFRAYSLIFNEFYRDEDLVPKTGMVTTSGVDGTTNKTVLNIAWEKDYFTGARPWLQKGPDVSLPLGVNAPVVANPAQQQPQFTDGSFVSKLNTTAASNTVFWTSGAAPGTATMSWSDPGLIADLTNATAVNVNDVRRAFALQRYEEARAMYGSRYVEYLRYLGVRSSDSRLQRPEYLGGGKQTIAFSEVLRTGSQTASDDIGEMFGHGIAALRSRRYRRFFEEHGHVLSLMSVRPRTMYNDGVERMFNRRTKEDYWQKELEQIGQQEVLKKEIYANSANNDAVFGYADRYAEYRHIQSKISAEFRDTLNYWHLGRIFAAEPALNQSFVECDPSKRIHAEQTADVLWVMINNNIQARRMVRKAGVGRII